jgi:hypothetical protein
MPKTSGGKKRTDPTLRSTSGAGFEFEDLISAWLLVKMLSGEQAPAIGGAGTQLQAQVSTLGWYIDDLLLTTQGKADSSGRLAISAKGNLQVSASGLPTDFVNRAWEQWHDPQSPMRRSGDGLALVTLGTHRIFDPNWREVKNACAGSDIALTMSRIRSNAKQLSIFDSIQTPNKSGPRAEFGASLRLDGLRWIAAMLKVRKPSDYWYRDGTGEALVELLNASLNQNSQALVNDSQARQALVEISAALATRNIPTALALQERIKLLR